jgi:hypothetical protein
VYLFQLNAPIPKKQQVAAIYISGAAAAIRIAKTIRITIPPQPYHENDSYQDMASAVSQNRST